MYQRTLVLRFMFATKSPRKIANIKVRVAASCVWTNFVVGRSGKNARTRVYNKLRVCKGYWRLSYRYYMVDEPWEFLRKNVTPDWRSTRRTKRGSKLISRTHRPISPIWTRNFIRNRCHEMISTFIDTLLDLLKPVISIKITRFRVVRSINKIL